jgi:hypothetical protein
MKQHTNTFIGSIVPAPRETAVGRDTFTINGSCLSDSSDENGSSAEDKISNEASCSTEHSLRNWMPIYGCLLDTYRPGI